MTEPRRSGIPIAVAGAPVEEESKLRKSIRRFDAVFIMLSALITLDTLGAVSSNGPQALTWLVVIALTFFIPYALLVAELGAAFPQEGGPYEWVKLAYGRRMAAVSILMYWFSNPVYVGGVGTILAVTVLRTFFGGFTGPSYYVFCLLFIWASIGAAVVSLRVGKWVPVIGVWVRGALLVIFTVTAVIYGFQHGIGGIATGELAPTLPVFLVAAPVLVFTLFGLEVPNTAGGEMYNPQKDVPVAVRRATISAIFLYAVPIIAILLVLPASQLSGLSGFIDAMKTVFTVYGGSVQADGSVQLEGAGSVLGAICAIGFVFGLLSYNATWLIGGDRALAVAAYDGAGPRWLGRFTARQGTPISANLLSGVVATAIMVLASELTSGSANKYFSAVLALAISTGIVSYLVIFPSLIRLRTKFPTVERPYRIPGGRVSIWVIVGLTTFWAAFTTAMTLWPGLGTDTPDDFLPEGFADQRFLYEAMQLVPFLLLIILGLWMYRLGRKTRSEIDER